MAGRVEGKVAFITGAARGQGRAHALRLAEEGADIIAIDIDTQVEGVPYATARAEDLQETVRQVEALDRRIVAETCDVRDPDRLRQVVAQGVAELGRLDIVAGNAGVDIVGPWHSMTPEIVRTTIDINLIGVWNTVMAAVPAIIEAGNGGSIILTSSANGLKAGPWNMAYNMSKYGVTGMAKSFAQELAKDGIRVNSVHPGGVDTPMAQGIMGVEDSGFTRGNEENPLLMGMLTQWIPGMMPPREISNAVLFLASDDAAWVTGHALAVDGGMTQY
ncbi:mycofactocin-coupled SDR family oxidoreductase [Leucobacter allii]|uniref:Mycofactocin-coupled SDR family oxidoreductase n=1 Tax=Leucobacter allii TaxID=2932247 RepID=A0ABY4FMP6_9MICO|nr:mycofactocin-coupled SDR family oxidoreductase [Leucobacter allii]UOQ57537.1 mycofactocin-coupled SDR family oxidoreductase [Leucobacter allii]UOR01985.1 mycofactocin-coupled SDR family oxidoreductase [Leucobacter allii]